MAVAGCGGTGSGTASPSPSETSLPASHEYVGTPAEYADAVTQCMVRLGWDVGSEDNGALTFDEGSNGDRDAWDDYQSCRLEIGAQPSSDLSDEELKSRYEWRLGQYQCLLDGGFDVGEPMSFESFVDTYERTGLAQWDPIAPIADSGLVEEANQLCPYSTSEW